MRKRNKYIRTTGRKGVIELFAFMAFLFILAACSTTSAIPDGEHLYTCILYTSDAADDPTHLNQPKRRIGNDKGQQKI